MSSSDSRNVFAHIRAQQNTDALVAGNVVASTANFLAYCNDIYYGSEKISTPNNARIAISNSSGSSFSKFVEGPYKFLYNCVLVGLNDKIESTRVSQDIKSSIHVFSGKWRSDWVIDEEALFDDEKLNFFSSDVVSDTVTKVRNIISNPRNLYLEDAQKVYSWFKDIFLDSNDSNIDFYIEFTNSNVKWTNSIAVTEEEKSELSSSYNVVKIVDKKISCNAYTEKRSPLFTIPSGFGAYVIKEKFIPSKELELAKKNNSPIKNYVFELNTSHSYLSGSEGERKFDVKFNFDANVKFKQFHNYTILEPVIGIPEQNNGSKQNIVPGSTSLISPKFFVTTQTPNIDPKLTQISNKLHAFAYTYDIDAGNYWDEYKYIPGSMNSGTYVKYIQLTLNAAGYKTPISNNYTAQTEAAIIKFQKNRGLKGNGIVDSQTKQSLARVWRRMSKVNIPRYNEYIQAINKGNYGDKKIDNYIKAAIKSIDADVAFANGEIARLINFSGISNKSRDPEQINLWVQFNFPALNDSVLAQELGITNPLNNIEKILGVVIQTPEFSSKAPKYKGVKYLDWNINNQKLVSKNPKRSRYYKNEDIYIDLSSQNFTPKDFENSTNSLVTAFISEEENSEDGNFRILPYPNEDVASGKKGFAILLQGSKLGGSFGSTAEGMAIGRIYFKVKYKDEIIDVPATPNYEETQVTTEAYIDGTVKGSFVVKNVGLDEVQTKVADPGFILNNCTLKDLQYYPVKGNKFITDLPITYTVKEDETVSLNNKNFKPDSTSIETIDLSGITNSISIKEESFEIVSVIPSGEITTTEFYSSEYIESSVDTEKVYLNSNISYYAPGQVYQNAEALSNFYLRSVDGTVLTPGKNSVNYYDQLMLVCDQNGSPTGINFAQISNSVNEYQDPYYSDISVYNTFGEQPGLIVGFYDISSRKFLGKSISYEKYLSAGPQNVYIGLYAFDYDGNIETLKEFTEIGFGDTYVPTPVPVKMAYPVYKTISYPRNKIQLLKTPDLLEKTEPWPVVVSSGSFTKVIQVPEMLLTGWASRYKGQKLMAKYDTSNIDSAPFSKIFGRGYLDITEETPIINSSYSISVKLTPIHRIHSPSNDLSRFGTSIKPIVKVYTRESEQDPWIKVDDSKIKNVNCETGLIEFKEPLISFDPTLNKVSYTIKSNFVSFKQSNGVPIPINPFLNKGLIQFNKPLYIYLKPKQIYKQKKFFNNYVSQGFSENNIVPQVMEYVPVEEYNYESVVNFTYNNNIFNKLDSYEYDPFAIPIGIIYVSDTFNDDNFNVTDLRVKGGGVSANFDTNTVLSDIEKAVSYWDVYPPLAEAYPKGGYVIIRIPNLVKANFLDPNEVYSVIKKNLTAGVVFELQDMEGKDWSTNA